MIDLYYWTTPNGHKITIFLEEAGVRYSIKPITIGKGEQFQPEFLKISPNNRIPAIVDTEPADEGEPLSVFESGAILEYLAVKAGAYLPRIKIHGAANPVVEIIDEKSGELVYGLRLAGNTWQPHVFQTGSYTLRISVPESGRMKALPGLEAKTVNDANLEVTI